MSVRDLFFPCHVYLGLVLEFDFTACVFAGIECRNLPNLVCACVSGFLLSPLFTLSAKSA